MRGPTRRRREEAAADAGPIGGIDPQEIARVSLFLCSADASFMTGAAVTVDGGIAAGRMGHMR